MPTPRLLSYDPETGIEEYFEYDDQTGEFTIHKRQRIDQILRQNEIQRNSVDEKASWKHNGSWDAPVKVAEVPFVVAYGLMQRGILGTDFSIKDRVAYKKWLNDPENEVFRTRPGKV